MLMLFILLLTYNRVQVIKLYLTYAALKSVTGEKQFAVLTLQTTGAKGRVLKGLTPTLPTKCYSDLKKKSK